MQPSLLRYSPSRVACRGARGGRPGDRDRDRDRDRVLGTTEDILNSILPPREWSEGGQVWAQSVSSQPATKGDVLSLEEELERRLKGLKAKQYGVCRVREELFAQCFDELLRQVTIQCAERGLLLNRVRGELKTLMKAHKRLYESSAAFGVRKALLGEAAREAREAEAQQLAAANQQLAAQLQQAQQQLLLLQQQHQDRMQAETKEHENNLAALRRKSQKVKREIERLLLTIQQT